MLADEVGAHAAGDQQREAVAGVQAFARRGEAAAALGLLGELAEHEAVLVAVDGQADVVQRLDVFDEVGIVEMALEVGGGRPAQRGVAVIDRVVGQGRVVEVGVGDVEPEAIDAPGQPEVEDVEGGLAGLGMTPVELGLLAQELVVVGLSAQRLVRPGRAAEGAEPVVGGRAVGLERRPDVPVLPLAALERLVEPGVFVAGVGQDLVEEQLHAALVGPVDDGLQVVHRAVVGVDAVVVADVVAPVAVGRGVDRREPDGVDAERGDVVEFAEHPRQVAMAVAIAVEEAADVDVIDGRAAPPGGSLGHGERLTPPRS
ncbi:MAG: hypothetical protein K0R83_3064 [Caulobacter sp.]|nr:hypothetical protein [Caulobacter sp.]